MTAPMAVRESARRRRQKVRDWACGLACLAVLLGMMALILAALYLFGGQGYTLPQGMG